MKEHEPQSIPGIAMRYEMRDRPLGERALDASQHFLKAGLFWAAVEPLFQGLNNTRFMQGIPKGEIVHGAGFWSGFKNAVTTVDGWKSMLAWGAVMGTVSTLLHVFFRQEGKVLVPRIEPMPLPQQTQTRASDAGFAAKEVQRREAAADAHIARH